ncbi:MAG TPA: DUF1538 domain-containing protein [Candidatus Blautia faecavium]|uniref:DUF1538 domain-containing protein n=1 Tax=Candidatus Blautia faecavium TaxID=2838487 RepID=A0A9D2RVZ7_9FIRM|nr:DUF1538 domain-containing protein [Candidatus Blautia faecavium]
MDLKKLKKYQERSGYVTRKHIIKGEIKQFRADLNKILREKFREAVNAVLPIMIIVLLLCFTIAPISPAIMLEYIIGAVMLVIGMMFFSLGAEMSMTPMGEKVGSSITKSRKLWVMCVLGFILGFIITISEPDLQVLAEQVPSVPNMVLILAVAVGVGIFLVIALLRILFSISLPSMLVVFYAIVFILAFFTPKTFLAVAFDSGGVTTGPMTVPFIMALGIGISSIRNDKHAADDSFGLVALCSIGPILAVLILGIVYKSDGGYYAADAITEIGDSVELAQLFVHELPKYFQEIAVSLLPIVLFFAVFQIFSLNLGKRGLIKIVVGMIYTYLGLVLFLTGVNVGFMPAGNYLGQVIAGLPYRWIIIPIGMIIGYFIVMAEPAVYVLTKQVEELTDGMISGTSIKTALSISVAVSVGLAMLRVLTGISIFYFVIPGYGIAILLSFFVPKIFTAIAFDSGGVASGPMTTTFLLPFAIGACISVGGEIVSDAFGVVAMVAMTPLITIQVLGLIFKLQEKKSSGEKGAETVPGLDMYADDSIIDL